MKIRLSYSQIHEAMFLSEGRIKESAAYLGVCKRTFVRNAIRNGIDWRAYRKSLCTCGKTSPRCEGCKKQNRDSQMRTRRARNNMMSFQNRKNMELHA